MLNLAMLDQRPWWKAPKYIADGQLPAAIADYRNDRYMIGGRKCAFGDFHAFTASSPGSSRTYVGQDGLIHTDVLVGKPRFDWSSGVKRLLLENQSTNLLLNSSALSTQSVTVSAQAYTLSFYGTGSVTLSGTGSGTLSGTGSGRVTLTFTPTAGTLTVAVTGSVLNAQLETGSFASSYIPTTSTAVTRAVETALFSPVLDSLLIGPLGSILVNGQSRSANQFGFGRLIGDGLNRGITGFGNPSMQFYPNAITINLGQGTLSSGYGVAASWSSAGRSISANGATTLSDANLTGFVTNTKLGTDNIGEYFPGWVDAVVIYPFRVSDGALQQKAMPYAA